MLSMSDINDIRDLGKKGYRISEIHKKTGMDPKTIRKYMEQEDFPIKIAQEEDRPSILDPFKETIARWLEEDRKHWNKQRHTAQRVYDRLKEEEGYTGSYETVQRYLKKLRIYNRGRASQELVWDAGCAQVDFGEGDFYEENTCVRRKYLVVSFPCSNNAFVQLFGGETAECVCQGLKDTFEHIGGVPSVLIFDNAAGVGHRIHDKVTETDLFRRFRAHCIDVFENSGKMLVRHRRQYGKERPDLPPGAHTARQSSLWDSGSPPPPVPCSAGTATGDRRK